MKLSRKAFRLLVELTKTNEALSQRKLASATGYSLGSVNQLVRSLTERGLMKAGRITESGLSALQPYRVRFAERSVGGKLD